jgi:hypothetical protein
MMQQPIAEQDDPVVKRRRMAGILLEYLKERENQWISVRDLARTLFSDKTTAIGDVISWLSRREFIFTQTTHEGKRKVKLVSYRPPPPDQCKYCRGKGCLICEGTGKFGS